MFRRWVSISLLLIGVFQAVQAGLGLNYDFASSILNFEAGVREVSDALPQEWHSLSEFPLDEFQSFESLGRRPTI